MDGKVKEAYEIAKVMHQGQKRKSGTEEYITHILKTYELVREHCDDEEVQCAAILHDITEDTPYTNNDIKKKFGEKVAGIVEEVSTNKEEKKALSWKERKQNTVRKISTLSENAQIVEVADKVANASDFPKLMDENGKISFENFNEKSVEEQEWYYRSLYTAFCLFGKTTAVTSLAKRLREYTDIGFGQSYEHYMMNEKKIEDGAEKKKHKTKPFIMEKTNALKIKAKM